MPRTIDVTAYAKGVLAGDRGILSRAITLVESSRADHRGQAQDLLVELLPHAGGAQRVGITGVPGVGKSTFIDQLGTNLTEAGHKVAVLAVDPSSTRTGGSILGDKTRMARLAVDPSAFIRPSPTSGTLGGVARATRETIVLMEAAGYDVVLVETVGVGQSEVAVANMVDCFLFLTLARTGDQLQGIKKGVLELADVIAVNKADGEHEPEARKAARELSGALRMIYGPDAAWTPPVLTCSALTGNGLDTVWQQIGRHRQTLEDSGELARKRSTQQVDWTWSMVREQLLDRLATHPSVRELVPEVERDVREGRLTATLAAERILEAFGGESPRGG
ncbi:methylmalonyl Co-A mutase-associated GTPase MeaB [Prauserella endophytica]|uniref:Methylmalonyl Co-A mutase-associated GTPase MeaB n=1 Tax=Prauserella endophytica TaxID=1592324 RepID=A0ABY2RX37_9PSEU|nr:methylmalonyl Co-A mutase-associated GTPase MeaB [Prauserella endophytica]PXY19783.1 ATPase/protein kinase [Prauserella coralliicola]TKG64235.1 methylmalonyl Co-A mutase-associated GTPase MeaB [Prauserella endophytica]